MVADAMEKVSNDGVITIEESQRQCIQSLILLKVCSLTEDMFRHICATDMDKMEANLDNPYILITDKKISAIFRRSFLLLEQIVQSGSKLLIIAEDL